jgi:hypothetical protein
VQHRYDDAENAAELYCDVTKLPYMGGGESALVDSILGYSMAIRGRTSRS